MLLLAASRGHGSTICTTLSPSTALPPSGEMASRRARYSEQPASEARASRSPPARSKSVSRRIGASPWHVEHVAGERLIAGGRDALLGGRRRAGTLARHFGLAEQEEVGVARRQRVVGRRADAVAGPGRPHQMRRDDDGEIRLVLLVGLRREQGAEHRYTAEPRQLFDLVLVVGLQQAADHEALAVAQFDR